MRQRLRSVQSLEKTVTTAPQQLVSPRRAHIDVNLRTSSKAAEKGHLLTEDGALHGTVGTEEEQGAVQIAPAMIALILRRVASLGAQINAKDDEMRKAEKASKDIEGVFKAIDKDGSGDLCVSVSESARTSLQRWMTVCSVWLGTTTSSRWPWTG